MLLSAVCSEERAARRLAKSATTSEAHIRRTTMQRATALLTAAAVVVTSATLGANAQTRRERFRLRGQTDTEATATLDRSGRPLPAPRITEAPTGFDNLTNGFLQQGPAFESLDEDTVVALRSFNDNRFIFEEVEVV